MKKIAAIGLALLLLPALPASGFPPGGQRQMRVPGGKVQRAIRVPGGTFQRAVLFDATAPVKHKVAAGDTLRFLYGISEPGMTVKAPMRFTVSVKAGWKSQIVFDETLNPSESVGDAGWKEGRVPLSPFEGRDVTIRFKATSPVEGHRTDALWAGLRLGDFTRRSDQYNVILISIDTLRADHLGVQGYARDTSPKIDQLARAGVYFKHGVAASSWTKPSHATILSGLYPSSHQLGFRPKQDRGIKRMSPDLEMLAETLQNNGFITRAFTGGGYVSAIYGFSRGFDVYQEKQRGHGKDAALNFGSAMDWLSEHRDDRFFLFVHSYEVHDPYRHKTFVKPGMDPHEAMVARYDSGIRFTDDYVGRLVDRLKELRLLDSTLIVLTSDHGDELYERGYTAAHGHSLYDDQVRVPFLFYNASRIKPRLIDDQLVQHVDIAPTILDFVGLPRTPHLQGQSLVPVLEGGAGPKESVAFAELEYYNTRQIRVPVRQMKSIHYVGGGREYKLIISPSLAGGSDRGRQINADNYRNRVWLDLKSEGGRQLYDLKADPGEKKNIAKFHPDILSDMENSLRLLSAIEDRFSGGAEMSHEELSREAKEHLRSLGY